MIDPKKLEGIAKQITDSIPPGVKQLAEGLESRIKTILQTQLTRLDFVSREEFDVQTQVLIKTRQKLDEMSAQISAMQQQLDKQKAD